MARPAAAAFPFIYQLFFLYIEPIATAVGAYYAHFLQQEYLQMTYSSASTTILGPSTRESIVLSQLANMYAVFAFLECFVLRTTSDTRVWRVFLLGLLLADFGHIYSVKSVGIEVYWQFWKWNSMYWGNLGFVYVGATLRMAFLSGIGLTSSASRQKIT